MIGFILCRFTMIAVVSAVLVIPTAAQDGPAAVRASFVVNTASDGGDSDPGDGICSTSGGLCTLRAAFKEANSLGGGPHTVTVPAGYEIILINGQPDNTNANGGDLDVTSEIILVKGGAGNPPIIYNTIERIFEVHAGSSLTISDMWLWKSGLNDSMGGAIFINGGSFNGSRLRIVNNRASSGGGIMVVDSASFTLSNSFVASNAASVEGGGIAAYRSTGTIVNTVIAGNWLSPFTQPIGLSGGGVYIRGSNILNSDIDIVHSTIAFNFATQYGGGLSTFPDGQATPIVTLRNSIIARNVAPVEGADCLATSPAVTPVAFSGTNVIGQEETTALNSCFPSGIPPSVIVSNAGFAQMADLYTAQFGEAIPTLRPLADHPAIGALAACAPEAGGVDMAGTVRPQGALCDIGAVESAPGTDASVSITPDPLNPGGAFTITVTDPDRSGAGAIMVEATTDNTAAPDVEILVLTESPPNSGIFTYSASLVNNPAIAHDAMLQAGIGHTIVVRHTDPLDGEARQTAFTDTAAVEGVTIELITNGGFESNKVGWTFSGSLADSPSKKQPFEGLKSFRFVGTAGKAQSKLTQRITNPPLNGGDTLTFSAQIRASGAPSHKMVARLVLLSGTKVKLQTKVSVMPFTMYALDYVLPEPAVLVEISFLDSSQSGKVYVDSVSIAANAPAMPRDSGRTARGSQSGIEVLPPPPPVVPGFRGRN